MKTNNETTAVWASPHKPTQEQKNELLQKYTKIEFLEETDTNLFKEICSSPSEEKEIKDLAKKLLNSNSRKAIIQPAGSPAFQFALGAELDDMRGDWNIHPDPNRPITVAYAHSERESIDEIQKDGSIKKTSIFKHKKFIYL